MPLDDEQAKDLVKRCIRQMGLPTTTPIRMENKLSELLITNAQQVMQLRVRISEGVERLQPPHRLDIGHLSPISKDSTVRSVIEIVAAKSTPINAVAVIKIPASPKKPKLPKTKEKKNS